MLTAGEFINDRGEIGASGVLPNGDHHAILLLPCDQTCNSETFSAGSDNAEVTPNRPLNLAAAGTKQN
jgi:hypothetical protein